MREAQAEIASLIQAYYTDKVRRWGPTPLGVDWPDKPTQQLRYLQLLRIADEPLIHSWNELGCGYGAMLELISERYSVQALGYCGIDVSPEMLVHAKRIFGAWPGVRFTLGVRCDRRADYSIASGIFNVQLGCRRSLWETFVESTLAEMYGSSSKGVAVNFLRLTSELGIAATDLYTTVPSPWVVFGAEKLGAEVELVTGYGLAEFTLRLRRPGAAQPD